MVRALIGILACVMLAGCGAQGEAYQPTPPPAAKSVIYIYRPYKFLSSQTIPMITCGHESIELEAGGYYRFEEESEQVTCSVAGDAKSEYKFDAHADEEYFIREEVDTSGLSAQTRFRLVNKAVGHDEIAECSRQGIKQ
jgi:hypothetical protein